LHLAFGDDIFTLNLVITKSLMGSAEQNAGDTFFNNWLTYLDCNGSGCFNGNLAGITNLVQTGDVRTSVMTVAKTGSISSGMAFTG
jgi:hypothetical protein